MRRALELERLRLWTVRSTRLIAALALACAAGLALAVAWSGRSTVDADLAASVVNPGQPAPTAILLGLLGVLAWGHDYRYRTIEPILLVQPDRVRLATARFVVVTAVSAVLATAAVALAALAGVLVTGGALAGRLSDPPVPRMLLGSVLLGVGCTWFGMAAAGLLRSLPAAVAVLFAVPMIVEPLGGLGLAHLHSGAEGWLPFHAVGQVTARDQVVGWPPAAVGGGLFLAVMLALVGLAGLGFARRDA
jgi:ABC-2 type transport system permease protein